MQIEIERKFLVIGEAWRDRASRCRTLRDGLVSQGQNGKVRVRLEGDRTWLTIKGPRAGITRSEFEFEIPGTEGEHLLATVCVGCIVEKERYLVPHAGLVWEVDVFKGQLDGVIWAEVELAHEDQAFAKPDWVGREVTGDPRFRHAELLALCDRGVGSAAIAASLSDA